MNWRAIILLVIIIKSAFVVSFCCSNPNISSTCQSEIQNISCCSTTVCSDKSDIAESPDDSQDTSNETSSHCTCVHTSPMNFDVEHVQSIAELITIEKNEANHYVSPYSYLYSSKIFQPPRHA